MPGRAGAPVGAPSRAGRVQIVTGAVRDGTVAPGKRSAGASHARSGLAGDMAGTTVMVLGRTLRVDGDQALIRLDGTAVPLPLAGSRSQGMSYFPLRVSVHADLREVWALAERARETQDAAVNARRARAAAVRVEARARAAKAAAAAAAAAALPVPSAAPAPSGTGPSTPVTASSTAPVITNRGAIPYTAADLMLIARVVASEADAEPYVAQLGVAAVIVNRVRTPGFPKTIAGVVYAPGQFQGVGTPLFYAAPTAEALQAATAALQGQDPTDGAVHFFNPAMTWSGSSMFALPVTATYGAFRFTR